MLTSCSELMAMSLKPPEHSAAKVKVCETSAIRLAILASLTRSTCVGIWDFATGFVVRQTSFEQLLTKNTYFDTVLRSSLSYYSAKVAGEILNSCFITCQVAIWALAADDSCQTQTIKNACVRSRLIGINIVTLVWEMADLRDDYCDINSQGQCYS